jgi:hypothetical protein
VRNEYQRQHQQKTFQTSPQNKQATYPSNHHLIFSDKEQQINNCSTKVSNPVCNMTANETGPATTVVKLSSFKVDAAEYWR